MKKTLKRIIPIASLLCSLGFAVPTANSASLNTSGGCSYSAPLLDYNSLISISTSRTHKVSGTDRTGFGTFVSTAHGLKTNYNGITIIWGSGSIFDYYYNCHN
jgi:hypothetical protein